MSSKIDKINARLQQKITDGAYYEAQQQARVIAARYVKSQSYSEAIDILSSVAASLLKADQGGSGGDLSLYILDVYRQASLTPDTENKLRVLGLLRLFDQEEPTRKKFIQDLISWSSTCGPYPAGDPELHHVVGSLFAEEHDAYEAERHLIYGTKSSVELLVALEFDWYLTDDSHTAAQYAARAALPYLVAGNVRDASMFLRLFTKKLDETKTGLASQVTAGPIASVIKLYPSLPLLNFLNLLLVAVTKGDGNSFKQLLRQYGNHIQEVQDWDEALETIAEAYFGIARPRQGNPLLDMMGSMFGGGGGAPKKAQPRRIGAAAAPAEASMPEGLD